MWPKRNIALIFRPACNPLDWLCAHAPRYCPFGNWGNCVLSRCADRAVSSIAAMRPWPARTTNSLRLDGGTMSVRQNIKVAVAGVGNCASALVQRVQYYRDRQGTALEGVMRHSIGGYRCGDIEFVAAFDVDRRKDGRPLQGANFPQPNCTHTL